MSHNLDLCATYYTVIRGTVDAVVRPIKGLDLAMFPIATPVFDSQSVAEDFCDRFNAAQKQSGQILSLVGNLVLIAA